MQICLGDERLLEQMWINFKEKFIKNWSFEQLVWNYVSLSFLMLKCIKTDFKQ